MPAFSTALMLAMSAGGIPAADSASIAAEEQQGANSAEIVVIAERLRAELPGPIAAETSLDSDAIASLGASSVADILAQIASLTGGAQGRGSGGPVLLVNGRRIGSFDEVRNLPPEAIQRVDVLPEEAALRMGYPATSKPVNIVLKSRYAAITGELEDRFTTRGLRNDFNTEANGVDIAGDNRLNFNLQYQIGDAVSEARRGVLRPLDARAASGAGIVSDPLGGSLLPLTSAFAAVPSSGRSLAAFASGFPADDTAAFHTLVPSTQQFTADATLARALAGAKTITVSARFDRLTALDLQGPAVADVLIPPSPASPFAQTVELRRSLPGQAPVTRRNATNTYHLGAQLAGFGGWQWSAAVNYDRTDFGQDRSGGIDTTALQAALAAHPLTDPFATPPTTLLVPASQRHSASHYQQIAGELFASGAIATLPAGEVNLSLRSSLGHETIGAIDAGGTSNLSRTHAGGQAALDIPLLGKQSAIGALDGGINGQLDHYSDAETTRGYGATLNWKPTKPVSLLLAWSRDQAVPTIAQLGATSDVSPDAASFDYTLARSVVAARTNGGNSALLPDHRSVAKAELSLKPLPGLTLTSAYTRIADRDVLLAFPGLVSPFEAAFPGLIRRSAGGAVTSFDARPFNAAGEDRQELRLALAFNKTFGKGSGSGPRVPGSGGFGGGHSFGASGSMIQFTLSDTIRLKDQLTLASGILPIDLVGANSLGDSLRVPRHRIEAQLSATHKGVGLRANSAWISGGPAGAGSTGELRFADRFFLNIRLFYHPGSNPVVASRAPWLKGVRLMFVVDNLFDSYQRVADRSGLTPLAYQRGLVDPIGRTLRFSIRKTFD